jgi:glucokinase
MGKRVVMRKGLIVSCQALEDEPLHGGDTMRKMALAAQMSGAVAIRTNGAADIRSIKQAVDLPVIGLIKRTIAGSSIFITPTLDEVHAIIEAGADIVALDVTDREGRLGLVRELIDYAHQAGVSVMADISTLEEGIAAEQLGVDYIGTTLSGYTPYSPQRQEPDFELVGKLSTQVKCPVIAEGRIWTPDDAAKALQSGASYVVVGSAITRPQLITARYVEKLGEAYHPDSLHAIGVDIGGTKINLGVINRQGEVILSSNLLTHAGQDNMLERISEEIKGLLQQLEVEKPGTIISGIGVGTAGQVDWQTGSIRFASDLLPGYTGTKIKEQLHQMLELPVFVDNDVNVLALSEKYFGSARGLKHVIILALGTGVGGAIMVEGSIVHGAWGGAGEIGHMSVNFKGSSCICGNIGCLEQYASGKGIAKLMNDRLAAAEPEITHPIVDAKEVVARWLSHDSVASEVMDEVFAALGSAIASLVHIFNPELIVMGGGVSEVGEVFLSRVREETQKRAMPSMYAGVRIEASYQGNLSSMIGAGMLVWET